MAIIDSTELTFTAAPHLYQITPSATKIDARDQLDARVAQVSAMLLTITGEGFNHFKNMDDTAQQNCLWACAMAVDECQELLTAI